MGGLFPHINLHSIMIFEMFKIITCIKHQTCFPFEIFANPPPATPLVSANALYKIVMHSALQSCVMHFFQSIFLNHTFLYTVLWRLKDSKLLSITTSIHINITKIGGWKICHMTKKMKKWTLFSLSRVMPCMPSIL